MEETTPQRTPDLSAGDWDRQFADGAWSYLQDLDELAHHSIIAGYVARLGKPVSVLDVACGEGILRRLLPRDIRYLGTDWSAVAVEGARRLEDDTTRFIVADAQDYVPDRTFDVIVFNECLYYFASAIDTLRRYAGYLTPVACLIVSMYDSKSNQRIWTDIETTFTVLDRVRVTNAKCTAWQLMLLAPPAGRN